MKDNTFAIIFGSLIIAVAIFAGLVVANNPSLIKLAPKRTAPTPVVTPPPVVPPTAETTTTVPPTTKPQVTVAVSPTQVPFDKADIKQQLIDQTGISADRIDVSYGEQLAQVARGSVKAKDEMGGAGWFAAVDNGKWIVVYVGQGVPECDQVNPYPFPTSWISHCINADGNTVTR